MAIRRASLAASAVLPIGGPPGAAGAPGAPGASGANGSNGKDGSQGQPGLVQSVNGYAAATVVLAAPDIAFQPAGGNGQGRTTAARLAERNSLFDAAPGASDDALLSNALTRSGDPSAFPGLPFATVVEIPPGRPLVLNCGLDGSTANPPRGIVIGFDGAHLDLDAGAQIRTTLWAATTSDGAPKYRGQVTLAKGASLREFHAGKEGKTWLQHRVLTGARDFGTGAFNYAAAPTAMQWSIDEDIDAFPRGANGFGFSGFSFIHRMTGPAAKGGRNGIFLVLEQDAVTANMAAGLNAAYSATQFNCVTHTGDGGTTGNEFGSYYAVSASTQLTAVKDAGGNVVSAATGILDANTGERNLFIDKYAQVALLRGDSHAPCVAIRGRLIDCFISLSAIYSSGTGDGTHVGHLHGICFNNANSGYPLGSDGIIIGSKWFWGRDAAANGKNYFDVRTGYQYPIACAFDLTGFSFSQNILKTQFMSLANGSVYFTDDKGFGYVTVAATNADLRLMPGSGKFVRIPTANLPAYSSDATAKAGGVPKEGLYVNTAAVPGATLLCVQPS